MKRIIHGHMFGVLISCSFKVNKCFLTFFREAMVVWSSCDSFKAVETLAEFATISAFNSLHFPINLFSLSCDFFNAFINFSYSTLNFSRLLSPISSPSTSWKSFSSVSKALSSMEVFSAAFFSYNRKRGHSLWGDFHTLLLTQHSSQRSSLTL